VSLNILYVHTRTLDSHGSFAINILGSQSFWECLALFSCRVDAAWLDFPDLHATAREIVQEMFPDIPTAFTHDHALPDALALAKDFDLINVRCFRKRTPGVNYSRLFWIVGSKGSPLQPRDGYRF